MMNMKEKKEKKREEKEIQWNHVKHQVVGKLTKTTSETLFISKESSPETESPVNGLSNNNIEIKFF